MSRAKRSTPSDCRSAACGRTRPYSRGTVSICVIENMRTGIEDARDRIQVAAEIRCQHFHARFPAAARRTSRTVSAK